MKNNSGAAGETKPDRREYGRQMTIDSQYAAEKYEKKIHPSHTGNAVLLQQKGFQRFSEKSG